ncbi:MAG: zinc transporter ZntB [Xanthomonadales bacterium]|jgi:zinc transporter|nr:zinc transporter ZntB [Xanthomonadales bacterium]
MNSPFSWTHIDFSSPEGVRAVQAEPGITDLLEQALLDDDTRPRTLVMEEGTLLILRGVNLNPGCDIEDMISIRIWARPHRVVSTARRRLRSVETMKAEADSGKGTSSSGEFLCQLIQRLGDYMGEAVEKMELKLEEAEDQVAETGAIARNSPFSVIRRQCARIRRYLGPQREALEQLLRAPGELLGPEGTVAIREEANRLTLTLEDLDLVRERAMVSQEEFLGIVAHEQNTRMLVLSIIAAIFLPLSFLTGLMGMNVAGLPGTENVYAFSILVLLMVLLAGGILWLFRTWKWF